jgi:hypothetical protein
MLFLIAKYLMMLHSVVPFPGAFMFVVMLNMESWYRGSGMVLFRNVVNYC